MSYVYTSGPIGSQSGDLQPDSGMKSVSACTVTGFPADEEEVVGVAHRFWGPSGLLDEIEPGLGDLGSQVVQARLPGSGERLQAEKGLFVKAASEQRPELFDPCEVGIADRRRVAGVEVAVA